VLPTSFELTRTSWAPFAEVRLESSFGLSTQAGVRVDNPDDMSSVTSPRVRVAYEMKDTGFTVAGSWGKAFKLPSLYALGHPLVGNPDLVPERGESYELELSQDLPIVIEIVDAPEKIEAFMPDLEAMVGDALITLERAEVLLYRPGRT
jgi:outer membrane cobalamin receptor